MRIKKETVSSKRQLDILNNLENSLAQKLQEKNDEYNKLIKNLTEASGKEN